MPPILNHDGAYPLPSGRLIRPALRRSDGYSSIVQRQNVRLLIGKSLVRIQLEERNKFFACSQGRASYRGLAKRSGNGLQNRTGGFDSRNHVASGAGVDCLSVPVMVSRVWRNLADATDQGSVSCGFESRHPHVVGHVIDGRRQSPRPADTGTLCDCVLKGSAESEAAIANRAGIGRQCRGSGFESRWSLKAFMIRRRHISGG